LVDNLAIGVPIVSPAHACSLHVPLTPGLDVAYCEPDASNIVDVVEELLADPDLADGLAREARAFFDRHLHYRALGDYYLATCVEHL
jgi:glycosyltransferase involved in cell wall biosynthesis